MIGGDHVAEHQLSRGKTSGRRIGFVHQSRSCSNSPRKKLLPNLAWGFEISVGDLAEDEDVEEATSGVDTGDRVDGVLEEEGDGELAAYCRVRLVGTGSKQK